MCIISCADIFFQNFVDGITPFCGATDAFLFDFWWCLPRVSKPKWIPWRSCFLTCMQWIPQIHLLAASMAAEPFDQHTCTCVQAFVGLEPMILFCTVCYTLNHRWICRGAPDVHSPQPKMFSFSCIFVGKFGKMVYWRTLEGQDPLLWGILDPPLLTVGT